MTVNQNELLSALVDGELQGDALDNALQLLDMDEQARKQYQQYQYGRDVLQGHRVANTDISKQVMLALENEDYFSISSTSTMKARATVLSFPQQFLKQAVGLAVAASIGALSLVGVMNQSDYQNDIQLPTQAAAVEVPMVVATGERWTVGEQEVEERLNSYLVEHNEYSGAPDVFSYARVVSYDLER